MALFENLRSLFSPNVAYVYGGGMDMGVRIADMDAAALYRTQPNLRAAVTFLADNAAQVPLKVHRRASDNDRPRVTDSTAAMLLQYPNADMTPFEFKRWLYSDLLLYERFLMIVVPSATTPSGWEMRPVPNSWIHEYKGSSPFAPESVVISNGKSTAVEVPADKFVLWHGYDPNDPMRQSSRIAALKETLHEQVESNRFRRQMWHRGGRFNAYLTRPATVEKWTDEAFNRFKETWKASWAGSEAGEGGGMPILEDGMEIKTVQFNSRDAQWADSVKLAREDVASVYHFNPALLWPGSGQTYASAKDNARALYNDCLASTLMFATDRINHTLLPMVGEPADDYVVYDITIKTQGTFEERVSAGQTACGVPFMTVNEVRAEFDKPAIDGGDEIVQPLNMLYGGLASNHDTDPTVERYNAAREPAAKSAPRKSRGKPDEAGADELAKALRKFFKRQAASVLPKLGSKTSESWWDAERWDAELADELAPHFQKLAAKQGRSTIAEAGIDGEFDEDRIENYIKAMARGKAQALNNVTHRQLLAALEDEVGDDAEGSTPAGVFEIAEESRADRAGLSFATAVAGWAVLEAVRQNNPRGGAMKTWIVTSSNPRAEHAAMNGETVPYDDEFSNGAKFPGDQTLTPEQSCGCMCQVEITIP